MKDQILSTLVALRDYAIGKGAVLSIYYQEENSRLMRFANSAISLNTSEHIVRLELTAYDGRKRASYGMITDIGQLEEMKKGIDIAIEMAKHSQPLNYEPTVPTFSESFEDASGYDAALSDLSNEEKLAFINAAVGGLESDHIQLSGIFSCGENTIAQITTCSEHTQYFRMSDAQATIVLSHNDLKWEVQAEQSAHKKQALDPEGMHSELEFLLERYQKDPSIELPLGKYDIVFGYAAIADLLSIMNWIGFSGGAMKRGFSFISEGDIGKKVFSPKINLVDDPDAPETFPLRRDFTGIPRKVFPLITDGIFQKFTWFQDDADEYGQQPSGHTVTHRSIHLRGGKGTAGTLKALVEQPRDRDLLFIPFLHYMNIVNPSKGIVTGSSRFGALLLKKDGTTAVPYNVRLTQSLLDIFGDKVAWLSERTIAYNTSASYGARNPVAMIVPALMQVDGLEVSHSNKSY